MKQKKSNRNWTLILTFMTLLVVFMFIGYKLFDIQYNDTNIVITHDPTIQIVDAPRGNILSEDGRILSVTMPVYDIRLDLFTINKKLFEKEVSKLSIEINKMFPDKSASSYESLLRRNKHKRYFLLKRNVTYVQLQEMKKFPIFRLGRNRGGFIQEMKSTRDYPFGSLGKITVGKVKILKTSSGRDSIVPVNGIELAFNKYLQGVPGKEMNQEISGKVLVPKKSDQNILPQQGKNVITTINIEFQDAAELALKKKLHETKAKWGCAVLMDVETGDIKAIANLHRGEDFNYYDSKNHAIVSEIAPGSTFKLASFMSILEDKILDITDTVKTGDGKIKFYTTTISDTRKGGYGDLTFGDAFVVSSNVAISKLINESYKENPEQFISNLKRFRLTEPLQLQLPYRSEMIMRSPKDKMWSGTSLPSMSIGYEMSISPLQILTFYNAFANKGKMVLPRLVTSVKIDGNIIEKFPVEEIEERIFSEESVNKLLPYMEQVVSNQRENWTSDIVNGTANNIYTNKYKIAGKTGTCKNEYWNWSKQTKYERSYTSSFAGFFPADNPKYSCIVVINDFIDTTDLNHYGGDIAAPVFREISDKVFAFDSEMELFSNTSTNSENKIERVSVQRLTRLEENIKNRILQIINELDKGLMPNLKGMELMDVLYVLENSNLKFEYEGKGKVSYQSIKKGSNIKNQDKLKIKLF
ncbi:MAG: hypothetical protein CMD02_07470 [Flavobacteriales bacterium]|nr:hypothetical protein [Flavobacteriales bacterium]